MNINANSNRFFSCILILIQQTIWLLFEHWLENISIEHKNYIEILIITIKIQSATHSFPNRSCFYILSYSFMGAFDAILLSHLAVDESCMEKTECRNDHKKKRIFSKPSPRNVKKNFSLHTTEFPIRVSDHCACFSYIVSVHNLIFLWMECHSPN